VLAQSSLNYLVFLSASTFLILKSKTINYSHKLSEHYNLPHCLRVEFGAIRFEPYSTLLLAHPGYYGQLQTDNARISTLHELKKTISATFLKDTSPLGMNHPKCLIPAQNYVKGEE
jgi:hypothetical protein